MLKAKVLKQSKQTVVPVADYRCLRNLMHSLEHKSCHLSKVSKEG